MKNFKNIKKTKQSVKQFLFMTGNVKDIMKQANIIYAVD